MFKTFSNAWKIPEIRQKILFTLLMILVYRIGAYVPVPGVNVSFIADQVAKYDFYGMLNLFSGGSLSNMTIFALGITPYINASIIMQLLTVAIPKLERMSKEGDDGRKKIASITRYLGVILGLVQAIGIMAGLGEEAVADAGWFNYLTIVVCLTAGTALVMWIGERITENGIGNGISLLIFIGIVSSVAPTVVNMFTQVGAQTLNFWVVIIVAAVAFLIVLGITFVDLGERRIPVQYAKKVVGRKMYGGQSTHIPMKVNQGGVMPLIFAVTMMMFPAMIVQFLGSDNAFSQWYIQYGAQGTPFYIIMYAVLIFFFSYFYSTIAFNPVDVSKNLQQNGGFIPGIRPGKPTSDYLAKILSRITLFGAIFLTVIAALPMIFNNMLPTVSSAFGATSILILVSVALETTKQLEAQMMMRHYKGFLS